ncbi:MAG: BolA family protein [Alphaproteobacteria bacterium]
MSATPVATRIKQRLTAALNPTALTLEDESMRHAGHAGARPEGETHFRLDITASAFIGKSRLERHRMVNAILAMEFSQGLHALRIRALTPEEGVIKK